MGAALTAIDVAADTIANLMKHASKDLIVAAHNDAKGKIEARVQEETQKLMGGLPLPPGMKLPF